VASFATLPLVLVFEEALLTIKSLFGYDQGVMGGLLTLGSFVHTFPEINTVADPTNNHVTTIQGITVASYNLGCFVGAIVTIFIGDILGRRRMIFLGSTIVVIGVSAYILLALKRSLTSYPTRLSYSVVPFH
jgi:MFS family permease